MGIITTFGKTTKTRFQELSIKGRGDYWRFVATEDDAIVGPIYTSKTEILADLHRYATEYGATLKGGK